jgi:hypothetical protein
MARKSSKRRTLKVSDIIHALKTAGAFVKRFFSGLSSAPFAKRYYIATPLLVIFFIIITFPAEIIVTGELKKMEGTLFKSIKTEELFIAPFRDCTAKSIIITTLQKSDITFSDFDANLGTISLLMKKINGTIEASSFKYRSETTQMTCSASIDSNLALDSVSGMPISGTLSILLSDVSIDGLSINVPNLGGMKIKPVTMKSAKASFTCANKVMTIKDCTITGKDINGSIKGSMTLDRNSAQLNLTIDIDGNSLVLSDFKAFLSNYINASTGKMSITIQGSTSNPTINLISQNQNSSPVAPSIKR